MLLGHLECQSHLECPSLSVYLLLALGVPTHRNTVCCSRRKQAPGTPTWKVRTLHQCDDRFFLCVFIWEFQHMSQPSSAYPPESHRDHLPSIWHVDPTTSAYTCPTLGEVEKGMWNWTNVIQNSRHCPGEACAAAQSCRTSKEVLFPWRLQTLFTCHY